MRQTKPILLYEKDRIDTATGFRYNLYHKTDNHKILHYHEYYELCFLPNEECIHFANGKSVNLPKCSLLFLRPDDCHDFLNPEYKEITILHIALSRQTINDVFHFLNDSLLVSLNSCELPPFVILSKTEKKELLHNIADLNSISFNDQFSKKMAIRQTCAYIFSKYFAHSERIFSDETSLIPPWLCNTMNEMKKIDNFSLGIEQMVKISGVTKEHLCRTVKKYYGYTVSDYINELRLTHIANALIYQDDAITDICFQSGFSNLSWMYSLFHKKYGMSPNQFRKTHVVEAPDIIR